MNAGGDTRTFDLEERRNVSRSKIAYTTLPFPPPLHKIHTFLPFRECRYLAIAFETFCSALKKLQIEFWAVYYR